MDMGGYLIVINADKVIVTGNKTNQKLYRSHPTAKPGTLKTENFKQLNQVTISACCWSGSHHLCWKAEAKLVSSL